MLISRMLYGVVLLLSVRGLDDTIKINILSLGSIQLISILLEFNFVNNSLKVLAPNTTQDPQRYLTFLLTPIALTTVVFTFVYATFIFGFNDYGVLLGCSCFIALQQFTKIPDISMKLKGFLKLSYTIETFSTFAQISSVVFLFYAQLLSTQTILLVMILSQILQLLVKNYIKIKIRYSQEYHYANEFSTLYYFYRPALKFSTITISTTLFVSLIIPLIAVSVPASQGYFLLLAFRVLTYCDQLSWSPFYSRLPMIHQDFNKNDKMSMQYYQQAAKKVLIIFTILSIGVIGILCVPRVQLLLDYQVSLIVIPLFIILFSNRAVAMNIQILFAKKNISVPYVHLIMVFLCIAIFARQTDYLGLCVIIFFISLLKLYITNLKEIKKEL